MTYTIYFVFLDGVGLGVDDPEQNPFAALSLPAFEDLLRNQRWIGDTSAFAYDDHVFRPIDANLGVEGLPQSGTGQATLFTGVNGAKLAGRHYGPFPHSLTRPVLASHNVFQQIQGLALPQNEPSTFANAYPDRFFAYVQRSDRWTVTTRCCLEAGLRIRTHRDLVHGEALPADITAHRWPQTDPALQPITEAEASLRLIAMGEAHAFVLFEYFHTDKAGHAHSMRRAAKVLHSLDRFFGGLLSAFDPSRMLLLITSDHGNLEDLSTKSHTRNPVPLIAYGRGAHHFETVHDLTGVTPAIVQALRDVYQITANLS